MPKHAKTMAVPGGSPRELGAESPGEDGGWLGARLHPLLLVPLGGGT